MFSINNDVVLNRIEYGVVNVLHAAMMSYEIIYILFCILCCFYCIVHLCCLYCHTKIKLWNTIILYFEKIVVKTITTTKLGKLLKSMQ